MHGPPILRCEVEKALRRMKWRKAERRDGVVVEMVEAAGNLAIVKLTDLENKKYITQVAFRRG